MGRVTRRAVLKAAAGAFALSALPACGSRGRIGGRIVDDSAGRGHRLRDGVEGLRVASREDVPVVIAGGGVAGLSAAWKLARSGEQGFLLLELEDSVGGTAAGGESPVSRYPWGAHYVPVPTREQRTLCELLFEGGVIRGFDGKGRAIPAEEHLCRAPEERLFFEGEWREGLYPREGASADDLRQWDRFEAETRAFGARRDADGRRAFAIPTARSSRDPALLALDGTSMAAWLSSRGYDSRRLLWTVEYACRDDFGARLGGVSAWAGIHYYAARIAVPGDEAAPLLTWPEGNAFLVRLLARSSAGRARTGAVVLAVEPSKDRVVVRWLDVAQGVLREAVAEHVVCALPRFAARRAVRGLEGERGGFETSPWAVANVTLSRTPRSRGFAPAWDNVLFDSESLGYVDATHQTDRAERDAVWTWYRPFPGADPAGDRARLLATPWESWRDQVLSDLAPAHDDFEGAVVSIDVRRWGHGMVRPEPGFLWGEARRKAALPLGRVHFAAADLGGLPLFEEAQWAGVRAAEEVLAARGKPFESSL